MTKEPKRPYCTPRLTRYGSIRNLTGGSGVNGRDGDGTMTRNTPGGG